MPAALGEGLLRLRRTWFDPPPPRAAWLRRCRPGRSWRCADLCQDTVGHTGTRDLCPRTRAVSARRQRRRSPASTLLDRVGKLLTVPHRRFVPSRRAGPEELESSTPMRLGCRQRTNNSRHFLWVPLALADVRWMPLGTAVVRWLPPPWAGRPRGWQGRRRVDLRAPSGVPHPYGARLRCRPRHPGRLGCPPCLVAPAHGWGQTDPAMTLRLYGHLFEGAQVQLSEKIDALRAATMPTEGTVVPISQARRSVGGE